MHRTRAVLSLVCVFAVGCEASCNLGGKIDPKKAEALIRDHFKAEGGNIKNISCPSDVKTEKGKRFTCEVIAENGDILSLTFDQLDGKGNVKVVESDELVVMSKIEVGIAALLKKNEIEAGEVTCPADKKAVKDAHFECTAKAPDRTVLVGVDETDAKGNVTYGVIGVVREPDSVAAELVAELAGKDIKATVDCGKEPIRITNKALIKCTGSDDKGKDATIEVLGSGDLGGFQWRVTE